GFEIRPASARTRLEHRRARRAEDVAVTAVSVLVPSRSGRVFASRGSHPHAMNDERSAEVPESKGERTRSHILATALRLFREHGYEETSMRRIAEVAGVSTGNAYHYFES